MGGAAYVLTNFASPIVFYLTFHKLGAKAAIGLTISVTVLQLLFHGFRKQKPTIFFIITTLFIVIFGGVDLFLSTPRFFSLEPFVQNFLIASFFLSTYLAHMPIYSRIAADLPARLRPKQVLPEKYYRKVTLAWIVYLYTKSGLFLFLAFAVNLGELILLRSIIGGGTLLAMLLGELRYRKKYISGQHSTREHPTRQHPPSASLAPAPLVPDTLGLKMKTRLTKRA